MPEDPVPLFHILVVLWNLFVALIFKAISFLFGGPILWGIPLWLVIFMVIGYHIFQASKSHRESIIEKKGRLR